MKFRTLAVTLLTCAALTIGAAMPAHADDDDDDVHPQLAAVLQEVPGGEVEGYYEAYWPELEMTMLVVNPLARSVGSCGTGLICAYTGRA